MASKYGQVSKAPTFCYPGLGRIQRSIYLESYLVVVIMNFSRTAVITSVCFRKNLFYIYTSLKKYGTPNVTKIEIKSRGHPVKLHASEIVECCLKKPNVIQKDSNSI